MMEIHSPTRYLHGTGSNPDLAIPHFIAGKILPSDLLGNDSFNRSPTYPQSFRDPLPRVPPAPTTN